MCLPWHRSDGHYKVCAVARCRGAHEVAIVLVYACADELWLSRYNPKDDLLNLKLIQVSPRLAAGAVVPAMFLYRTIGNLTNWPAFAVTTLWVILTSVIWEVTLAIPRQWWGYEPFASILTYEFAKALTHHPSSVRVALFESVAPET